MASCIVPGCDEPGVHAIGVRIRKPGSQTSAVIAPKTNASLCKRHLHAGFEMDIVIRPKRTKRADIYTWAEVGGVQGHAARHVVPIPKPGSDEPKGGATSGRERGRVQRPA
jgi:hypothetical protein